MNGTSLDGIDYVLCSWSDKGSKLRVVDRAFKKFPPKLLKSLQQCASNQSKTEQLALTHFELGRMYEKQIASLISKNNWKVDYIAVHGQTVYHQGKKASLQIGEVSFLSKNLGIPTIYDFRSGDIALSGQGAPLAGLFHEHLFLNNLKQKRVAFHNIGGISNLTYLFDKQQISFDTGPGNMLMDLFITKYTKGKLSYDKNGKLAKKGQIDNMLVRQMMNHSFFKKKAPKSCGREEFGEAFLNKYYKQLSKLGLESALATLNWFTAFSIFQAYQLHLPQFPEKVFLCGGGAENKTLAKNLKDLFMGSSDITDVNELGIGNSDMEAMAFAFLGVSFLKGSKLNLPKHTGGKSTAILGKLSI